MPYYLRNRSTITQKRTTEDAGFDEELAKSSKKSRIDDDNNNDAVKNFNAIIPDEIKNLIFENLSFKDLMAGSLVCKKWNTMIAENQKLTKKMVKYQENHLRRDGSTQFSRKYVNYKFRTLPRYSNPVNFEEKFGITRDFVKSIAIHVKVEFSLVKAFLNSFPNLVSLELVKDAKSDIIFPLNQPQLELNLQSLKIFKITTNNKRDRDQRRMRFFSESLKVISRQNQLESLELINIYGCSNDEMAPYSEELCSFLNSQSQLKCLVLDPFVPIHQNQSGHSDFNPQFKLDKLVIRFLRDVLERQQIDASHRLLNTCIQTCQSLEFVVKNAQQLFLFSEVLNFEKLDKLKLDLRCDLSRPDVVNACNLWSGRTMKSQLKTLEVVGDISDSNYNSNEKHTSKFLLHFIPKSIESLALRSKSFPCEDEIWKFIGKLKKLKYFGAPNLTEKVLRCFKGNSLESLNSWFEGSSPPIGAIWRADEAFWKKFGSRNPNCKSIKYNNTTIKKF